MEQAGNEKTEHSGFHQTVSSPGALLPAEMPLDWGATLTTGCWATFTRSSRAPECLRCARHHVNAGGTERAQSDGPPLPTAPLGGSGFVSLSAGRSQPSRWIHLQRTFTLSHQEKRLSFPRVLITCWGRGQVYTAPDSESCSGQSAASDTKVLQLDFQFPSSSPSQSSLFIVIILFIYFWFCWIFITAPF